jgi:hypothetical protein
LVAVERYRLSERNAAIPDDLPALWVGLGQLNHGQSLALSIIDTDRQARALIRVAEALAAAGWPERAGQLGRSITDAHWRAAALTEVAGALAAGGQVELATRFAMEAEQVGRSINDAFHQAEVLSRLTETWVAAGKPERAEQVARSITFDYQQTQGLDHGRGGIGSCQGAGARGTGGPQNQGPEDEAKALSRVAEAWTTAGKPERAEQVAGRLSDPHRTETLIRVPAALAAGGWPERAEQMARRLHDSYRQPEALMRVAEALAAAGQLERAEQVARSLRDSGRQVETPDAGGGSVGGRAT